MEYNIGLKLKELCSSAKGPLKLSSDRKLMLKTLFLLVLGSAKMVSELLMAQ